MMKEDVISGSISPVVLLLLFYDRRARPFQWKPGPADTMRFVEEKSIMTQLYRRDFVSLKFFMKVFL